MPSITQIKHQIKLFGEENIIGVGKEIKALPDLLASNEDVAAAVSGFFDNKKWFMICTSKRIIMLYKGLVGGLKTREILLSNISSISCNSGMLFGDIAITVSGNELKITKVSKKLVSKFVGVIDDFRSHKDQSKNVDLDNATGPDFIEQLQKLSELKDKGLLSEAEFLAAKSKILT